MSVSMAIVDFIPVILFLIAAVLIQRGLYEQMSKGAFALLSAGTIMVFCAGFMKALWKLLYAMNLCDFERLNQTFFPMQALGFLLAGISIVALLFFPQKKETLHHILCAILTHISASAVPAKKAKHNYYDEELDKPKASMNWIAECVNLAGQLLLLFASREVFKK